MFSSRYSLRLQVSILKLFTWGPQQEGERNRTELNSCHVVVSRKTRCYVAGLPSKPDRVFDECLSSPPCSSIRLLPSPVGPERRLLLCSCKNPTTHSSFNEARP
ncbi:unnamed protein product [Ectocarpus sp. 12 AP-2014]